MKKILSILSIIVLFSCSKSEDQIIDSPSAENYILDFRISVNGSIIIGTVNETDNTISLATLNANVESISPVITISVNSGISPNSNVPQDFSEPVTYRVTSEDGSVRTYQVTISNQNISLNDENKLLAFTLPIAGEEVVGTIDEANKVVNFNVAGADLTNLTPTVQISENATISPSASAAQNFKNEVAYTIIASDGTPAIYRVIVNNRSLSTENEIKLFSISNGTVTSEAIINREDGIISFDFGDLDRTNLTPAIEMSEYASVSPSLDSPKDFTNPVIYVVTAENGDQFQYKVIANLPVISNDGFGNVTSKFFSGAVIVVVGRFIDLSLPNSKIELSDGTNKYPLEIITAINSFNGLIQNSRITARIPASTPTNTNYEIVYSGIGFQHVSDYTVDIKQENSPLPLRVDKMEYNHDDELIITGENLTEYIGIPSLNGSFYLMDPRGSEITLNADRTELRVILDIRQLFPSYFGREAQEFNISFFDSERRIGRTIPATFN